MVTDFFLMVYVFNVPWFVGGTLNVTLSATAVQMRAKSFFEFLNKLWVSVPPPPSEQGYWHINR